MPRNTRRSVYRRLDSRIRVERITYKQRVAVLRQQLDAARQTAP